MAIITYNQSPYYDDYNPEKDFVGILAVAGAREQSREFTQVGSIFRDYMKRLGDALFRDGYVVEGCVPVVDGESNQVTISAGSIYYDGLVRQLHSDQTIQLVGRGTEVIGVRLETSIITEAQDSSLRNPAVGTEAAGTAGAHRIKQSLKVVKDDPQAAVLYRFEDGQLAIQTSNDEGSTTDVVVDILARRTMDENGNFKINGLQLIDVDNHQDAGAEVGLTNGKAYIEGYEVVKPYQTRTVIKKSVATATVLNEPKTFRTGVKEYQLNNYPAKQINRVNVQMEETVEMHRGAQVDGTDPLPNKPVIKIVSINSYEQGKDYQLSSDAVDWSVRGGSEPEGGSTYNVTYQYTKTMLIASEMELEDKEVNGEMVSVLKFKPEVKEPINNSQFLIDYDYYLARKDLLLLDKKGEVHVIEGIPNKPNLCESPINQDSSQLVLGTVMTMPNSYDIYIANQYTTRLTQAELYNLKRRIDDLEVSLAMTDLDREAAEGEAATDLRGIFTDGFVGYTKADVTNHEWACSIDLDMQEMTLDFETGLDELIIDSDNPETSIQKIGRVLVAPYTEVETLNQPHATGKLLVNPYAVFDPLVPIKLNPEVDNWIDTKTIQVVKGEKTSSTSLRRWWYHRGESWAESEKKKWEALGFADGGASLGWGSGTATKKTITGTEKVKDEAILYMRQREVTVTGYNFSENEDNIALTFNGIPTNITIADGSGVNGSTGTKPGTIKANAKGTVIGKFTIPANVPCGSVQVYLEGDRHHGEAVYKAEGRAVTMEESVLIEKTTVSPSDPLAQAFQFSQDQILTGVDLYFATKDPEHACCLQVRNMVNGYPGTTCYAEEYISPDDVVTSTKGEAATHVRFSQPVYCKADESYCIVILTDSNETELFIAELGKKDLVSQEFVTSQPYVAGVLFTSSNALTWSAEQTKDLKMKLYRAQWDKKGTIIFEKVTSEQMARVCVAVNSVDYKNSGIDWYYRLKQEDPWLPIETYVSQDLTAVSEEIFLKCEMNVDYTTSPIIAADCINLVHFLEKLKAVYVSRNITLESEYTDLKVRLQLCLPGGCSAKVYYEALDKQTGWVQLESPTTTQVSNEWVQYEWTKSQVNAKQYRVKIELDTANPLVRPRARKLINVLSY